MIAFNKYYRKYLDLDSHDAEPGNIISAGRRAYTKICCLSVFG